MKLSKLALVAALACGIHTGNAFAAQNNDIQLVSCDCGEPVCGCEATGPSCDNGGCGIGGCDSAGCGGCDSACGCGTGCDIDLFGRLHNHLHCEELGDPWTLFGERCGWSAGGWVQMGYHNKALPAFNNRPDEYQLHQAWLYAEKAIDTSNGFDMGGRIDYLYGTDGPNTQAFGTDPRGWDNSWDNGPDNSGYGHAIPQLYGEVGYGDLSVKIGHFYTIIGYEVVQATGNFFYSHAYTFNFSEPFTHTGALATYKVSDDLTAYGGYVMGWDSGFDDNGDSFLGGLSAQLSDDLNVTYAAVGGRFGEARFNGVEKGYMQSIVANYNVSENLNYVIQSDLLDTNNAAGATARETFDINQYLIYSLSDRLSVGGRFEWWQVQGDSISFITNPAALPAGYNPNDDFDFYALTLGLNYKPTANVTIRPEVRFDWIEGDVAALAAAGGLAQLENGSDDQTTFGIDTIFTF